MYEIGLYGLLDPYVFKVTTEVVAADSMSTFMMIDVVLPIGAFG